MTIRLNKVTRDLNVGITTVVEFLQKKGYTIEASPNAKITEEQYAVLVKEFSTDKNLKIESEKFSQERQNKDRNKASISIEGFESKKEKEEVVKTVIPEEARPKLKQVGKIDLDNLNKKTAPKVVEPAAKVIEQTPKADADAQRRVAMATADQVDTRAEMIAQLDEQIAALDLKIRQLQGGNSAAMLSGPLLKAAGLGIERRKLADERARLAGEDPAPRKPEPPQAEQKRPRGHKH